MDYVNVEDEDDEPMSDGIMNAPAAGHIRRLISRHHKTPNLKMIIKKRIRSIKIIVINEGGLVKTSQIEYFLRFPNLTCESLAAASLAWMMNPLNLDIIIVRMTMMMMMRMIMMIGYPHHNKGQPDGRAPNLLAGIIITIIIMPFSSS